MAAVAAAAAPTAPAALATAKRTHPQLPPPQRPAPFALSTSHADFSGCLVQDDVARLIGTTLRWQSASRVVRDGWAAPQAVAERARRLEAAQHAYKRVVTSDTDDGDSSPISVVPPAPLPACPLPTCWPGATTWYALNLTECWLTPDALHSIAAGLALNDSVAHLTLTGNEYVGDSAVVALANAITHSRVHTNDGAEANASASANANANANARADANAVAHADVPFNRSLLSLSVAACGIRSVGVQALARALASNTSLTRVDLSSNYVGEHSGAVLGAALTADGTAISSLSLNRCSLTSSALAPVLDALSHRNAALTELYADGNMLDFVCGQHLNRALRANATLTALSLDFNRLTDLGVLSVCDALTAHNRTLTALSCQYNRTSADSLSCFAQVLRANTALRSLHIRHESASTAAICDALRSNTTLTELSFTADVPSDGPTPSRPHAHAYSPAVVDGAAAAHGSGSGVTASGSGTRGAGIVTDLAASDAAVAHATRQYNVKGQSAHRAHHAAAAADAASAAAASATASASANAAAASSGAGAGAVPAVAAGGAGHKHSVSDGSATGGAGGAGGAGGDDECVLQLARMWRAPDCVSSVRFLHLTHTSEVGTRALIHALQSAAPAASRTTAPRGGGVSRLLLVTSALGALSTADASRQPALRRQLQQLLAANKVLFDTSNALWQRVSLAVALARAERHSTASNPGADAAAAARWRSLLTAVLSYV